MAVARISYSWPILLLLVFEALALGWAITLDDAVPPITAISIVTATLCLAIGAVALYMQPSRTTQLGGYLIVVLAAFILVPVRPGMLAYAAGSPFYLVVPAYALFRLINGALLATIAYHLGGHFPTQVVSSTGPQPTTCPQPTKRTLLRAYLVTAILIATLCLTAHQPLQLALLFATMLWIYTLIGRAAWRLACISREQMAANRHARQQARVLLISALLATIPSLLLNALEFLLGAPIVRADFAAFFLILFPLGTAYAILRHDLLAIDGTIRRALAYTALSTVALLVYFAVTLLLTASVARRWPELLRVVAAVSVLTATFVFAPLQQRVQSWVDRWLYPERQQFFAAINAAQQRLGAMGKHEDVVTLLTKELPAQIEASWATLALAPAPLTLPPQPTAPAFTGSLRVDQKPLGRYWLGTRQTVSTYEADEEAALHQLLQEAALVLAYGETIAELRQLNNELEDRVEARTAQIVTQQRALAAHEQRQRLARDLHDSVTQSLFSLNLSLRAIRKLGERDPQAAVAELTDQEAAAQQALTELRALLMQLRSDGAEERDEGEERKADLVARLAERCQELQIQGQLQVNLKAPKELWLSTEIVHEIAYIVREALHNVSKHSGQLSATVTVQQDRQRMVLTVYDAGQGFDWRSTPANATTKKMGKESTMETSFGLRGMQERAAQIGGELQIQSEPRAGTTVTFSLALSAK